MREKGERCITMQFLCLQSIYFLDTSIFYFGIDIGFCNSKRNIWDGLFIQWNQIYLPNANLEDLVDL